jgi:outer membrane protein OmpA-like peptidoglycan-associated protein
MKNSIAVLAFSSALAFTSASAADIAGAKDPPYLKRYEGSEIVSYQSLTYESYNVAVPNPQNPGGPWVWQQVEGQVTRAFYKGPSGHTVLEIFRNYEQYLKDAGFSIKANSPQFQDQTWAAAFYHQSWQAETDYGWTYLGLGATQRMAYLSATATKNNQAVTVAVYVANYREGKDVKYGGGKPVHFDPDNVVVVADVVVSKAVVNKMVELKAADIAEALATKGTVSIYGIYFDTDKSEIKPDSKPTLDEVASVLKIDRALKLEVSGHTDNTGDKAHNAKLSEARAQSVVKALVGGYGIDSKRLSAKGYGDTKPVAPNTSDENKAKNRRVELRKV